MNLSELSAISPIDGRYRSKTIEFAKYFSEFGLIKYRVLVEVEYFIALCEAGIPQLADVSKETFPKLRSIIEKFTEADANQIKDIEKVTNHDVKAVEYFLKEKFDTMGLSAHKEFIHFGLTSQDINNTAVPVSLHEACTEVYVPELKALVNLLESLATDWKNIPMLAKTHGQPASPTTLGKEINVFVYRLKEQIKLLETVPFTGKFGGATGNFNAHTVAYPAINWVEFGNNFLNQHLNIQREQVTTQISNYDYLSTLFDNLKRINTILIDLCRDVWTYVSMEYFKQKIKKGEIGSSAMPHKVNPIDFENAEGNLGIANVIFDHLSAKLPISRLQRDLTDSTVLRNVGVPLAHTIISFKSIDKGLKKLLLNESAIANDLEKSWNVVAEAIQTILRRESYPNPYEALKELTRTNDVVNAKSIGAFIDTLNVNDSVKEELRKITPFNYTGTQS